MKTVVVIVWRYVFWLKIKWFIARKNIEQYFVRVLFILL